MVATKGGKTKAAVVSLDQIKKLAIVAMFSDDELMAHLVLKGGNALDLIYKISTRASVDVDLSMATNFPGGIAAFETKVSASLQRTYGEFGLRVLDVKVEEEPGKLSKSLQTFWGGYSVAFKLIHETRAKEIGDDPESLRRNAINLGKSSVFEIDISNFEYVEPKESMDFEGYRIFVYSPVMILCEKLRAICQQLPEYGPIVLRTRPGSARARDFIDIHVLATQAGVDVAGAENQALLKHIFEAKHVPLEFLELVAQQRDFHAQNFEAVRATIKPGLKLENFDFYFDFVLDLIEKLKPLWHV